MPVELERFLANKLSFGQCASWAVWKLGSSDHSRYAPEPLVAPDFHLNVAVAQLNAFSTTEELADLHTDVVLVALNFAQRDGATKQAIDGLSFHAFHEETTTTSDYRLRDICLGTRLWGAYITDLVKFDGDCVKPIRDSQASNIKKMLRNRDFLMVQVRGLCKELRQLGCTNPTIIALGNDVYDSLKDQRYGECMTLLREALGEETKLLKVTHYSKATGISHSDYVARVYQELRDQAFF
ncbi:hypothetical protein CFELI_02445 [Corynebacterium felinum]|nr:hypothetical protein CFELI_02445 [Corynebacterium felinum]